tara:strand:- start:2 stop:265 length:264 start_codon:yes stop_codon:yes gene_type:complete
MFHLAAATFLIAAGVGGLTALPVSARIKTISQCAAELTERGFTVNDQDVTKDKLFEEVYGFSATKNNEKWEFKMDEKCKILYEHRNE